MKIARGFVLGCLFWTALMVGLVAGLMYHDFRQYCNAQEMRGREQARLRWETGKLLNYGVYYGIRDSNGRVDQNQ